MPEKDEHREVFVHPEQPQMRVIRIPILDAADALVDDSVYESTFGEGGGGGRGCAVRDYGGFREYVSRVSHAC